jgi:hypothetical protein
MSVRSDLDTSDRPYASMATQDIRTRLAEWLRFSPESSFDPTYMGRTRRIALREFRRELQHRGLPTV